MASSRVTYGTVRVNGCPCCIQPPVAFDSEEGKERRRRLVRHYTKVVMVQLPLAVLAVLSGGTSVGLGATNPSYPFLTCFPLVIGILMLIGGVFGRGVGKANLDSEVPAAVKRNVMVHYVLSVIGCTFSSLAAGFSGVALGYCLSPEGSATHEQCLPLREVKIPFLAIDIVLGVLLLVVSIVGCVLFCLHARSLGFQNDVQTLQDEVSTLRAQVAALSQAQAQQSGGGGGGGIGLAPPAYSEYPPSVSSVSRGYGYGDGQFGVHGGQSMAQDNRGYTFHDLGVDVDKK